MKNKSSLKKLDSPVAAGELREFCYDLGGKPTAGRPSRLGGSKGLLIGAYAKGVT